MIAEIRRIVQEACAQGTNVFGYGIWSHHIARVAENARRLAPLFGADPEIVEVAAILHDYASIKDEQLVEAHHLHGAAEAGRILRGFSYPEERIQAVEHCIVAHRASVPLARETPEADCLANADALTHMQQVPSLLHLVFVCWGMGIDEGTAWVRAKLQRSWHKLSPQVQALAQEAYQAALATLGEPASPDREALRHGQSIALGLLRSSEGVLLVKEAYGDHLWSLPGGVVEPGESFAQAAVRECREETGLETRVAGLVAVRERPDQTIIVFALERCGGELLSTVPGEIEAIGWFDRRRLDAEGEAVYHFIRPLAVRALASELPLLKLEPWEAPGSAAASLFIGDRTILS